MAEHTQGHEPLMIICDGAGKIKSQIANAFELQSHDSFSDVHQLPHKRGL